jgi:rubrerythrin
VLRTVSVEVRPEQRRGGGMGFLNILDKLLDFEIALANLYQWFSDGFRHYPEASKVFGRLSIQEQKHANLVKYQKRIAAGNGSSFQPIDVDLAEVNRLLKEIAMVRNSPQSPTLEVAIQLSIRLETSAAEKLHHTVVHTANPDLAPLVAQLARDDDKHVAVLESLLDRVTNKAS